MKSNNFKIGQKVLVNFWEGGVLINCLIKSKEIIKNKKKFYDIGVPINKKFKKYTIVNHIDSKYIIPKKTDA